MMYQKVLLAREYDLACKIMETTDPAEAKKYAGKEYFKSFSTVESIWDSIRKNVVKRGVRAKFTQNADLLNILLSTGSTLLAECSASDKLWGIGTNLHDHAWHEVRNWNEKNYLGMILMELRDEFHKEINMFGSVQNVDYYDAESIDVWAMTAGELIRIPQYYRAIHTYSDTLSAGDVRNCFYYDFSLAEWEIAMRVNMGGGLPMIGFYEKKQEVYEIYHRLLGKPFAK